MVDLSSSPTYKKLLKMAINNEFSHIKMVIFQFAKCNSWPEAYSDMNNHEITMKSH